VPRVVIPFVASSFECVKSLSLQRGVVEESAADNVILTKGDWCWTERTT